MQRRLKFKEGVTLHFDWENNTLKCRVVEILPNFPRGNIEWQISIPNKGMFTVGSYNFLEIRRDILALPGTSRHLDNNVATYPFEKGDAKNYIERVKQAARAQEVFPSRVSLGDLWNYGME